MNAEQIKNVLDLHSKWSHGAYGGVRADLSGADLSGADLSGAHLSGAHLERVVGIRVADCQWSLHGQCGRRLLAVELPTGLNFYCGCFSGNTDDLRNFIEGGDPTLKPSRLKALDFLLSCF